jgi:D-glycero-D-manno-heptose 1,7-bisphosphate phosphatase
MQKTAIILCGGLGTRTKELFPGVPKALIPVEGIPIIERIIKQLSDFTIFINVNESEKDKFEYLKLPLLVESKRYGNAGVIKQFYKELGDKFLVIHCDVLSDIPMDRLWEEHTLREKTKDTFYGYATIVVKNVSQGKEFGLVMQEQNRVVGFTRDRFINCGVYCFDKSIVNYLDIERFQDFDNDLFPRLIKNGLLHTYVHTGVWFDIGTKDFWDK